MCKEMRWADKDIEGSLKLLDSDGAPGICPAARRTLSKSRSLSACVVPRDRQWRSQVRTFAPFVARPALSNPARSVLAFQLQRVPHVVH